MRRRRSDVPTMRRSSHIGDVIAKEVNGTFTVNVGNGTVVAVVGNGRAEPALDARVNIEFNVSTDQWMIV